MIESISYNLLLIIMHQQYSEDIPTNLSHKIYDIINCFQQKHHSKPIKINRRERIYHKIKKCLEEDSSGSSVNDTQQTPFGAQAFSSNDKNDKLPCPQCDISVSVSIDLSAKDQEVKKEQREVMVNEIKIEESVVCLLTDESQASMHIEFQSDSSVRPMKNQKDHLRESGVSVFYPKKIKQEILNLTLTIGIAEISKKYGIPRKTISRWMKSKNMKIVRGRKPILPEMEELLSEWIIEQRSQKIKITQCEIRQKAKDLLKHVRGGKFIKFMASKGWLEKYFKRNKHVVALLKIK